MPDLPEDVATAQKRNATRLVPNQGTTGHFLAVVGQDPFQFAFRQVPESEIGRFAGSPDGELSAPIDSLVRNTDDHTLWINTDGETAWTEIGSGSATLPIIHDDTETTVSILHSSGRLTVQNVLNAGSVLLSRLILDDDGSAYLESKDTEVVIATTSGNPAYMISGGTAYHWAYSDPSLKESFMGITGLSLGVDDGTWSKPAVYNLSNDAINIWQGMLSPPADADLDPGHFGFWFDDTPGSASINWVAKDSAGTVVTGSTALT